MIKRVLKSTRSWVESRKAKFALAPLYGDSLWPWFRCFVGVWITILISSGASLWFEALSASTLTQAYAYGLSRFWVFYVPVFGFFLRKFYVEYTDDGVWTPGTSYTLYLRNSFRDFF